MQAARAVASAPRASRTSPWPRRIATRGPLYALVGVLSLIFGFPFLWTLMTSLKTSGELGVFPPLLFPEVPQWANYVRVFTLFRYPAGRWFLNTVYIVFMSTVGTVLSATLVAYGFARFRFRGRDALFMVTLGTMMLPSQVTLIPQFIFFHRLGWVNTFRPLWVPSFFGGGAFNIFLLRQFFLTLPRELDEAAKIDGAGYWRIFWQVLIPLCKPVVATIAIISFMAHWSDFMGPLIYLNKPAMYTISVGLRFFHDNPEQSYGDRLEHIMMAATVLSIIPCLIVFFTGQSYFVRGIVMSGIKG
ncbi:MAG: carbohydrate ABC transporter permease [Chloroflexota bacterium]